MGSGGAAGRGGGESRPCAGPPVAAALGWRDRLAAAELGVTSSWLHTEGVTTVRRAKWGEGGGAASVVLGGGGGGVAGASWGDEQAL